MTNSPNPEQNIDNAVTRYINALACPYDWWADMTVAECEPERLASLGKVVELGESAIEKLAVYATSELWFIRQGIAKAMGLIKSKKAIEHLMKFLNDDNSNVRNTAYSALELINQIT